MRTIQVAALITILAGSLAAPVAGWATPTDIFPFDESEPVVAPAPAHQQELPLPPDSQVVAVAVSPIAPEVAALIDGPGDVQNIIYWRIGGDSQAGISEAPVPADIQIDSIAWHPLGTSLFAAAGDQILAFDPNATTAPPRLVWQDSAPIAGLVAGPRPFLVAGSQTPVYRLFFAEPADNGGQAIRTVTEEGQGDYYVTSQTIPAAKPGDDPDKLPKTEGRTDLRPLGFHPAGNVMLLADDKGCFLRKSYGRDNWGDAQPWSVPCDGTIAYAPNGASLIHWSPARTGIEILDRFDQSWHPQLPDDDFLTAPSMTPDGRGIVGAVTPADGGMELRYVPLSLPLADVPDAWMFLASKGDETMLDQNRGLFRPPGGDIDQLYKLYDTESYSCGRFDYAQPARPYFVTTDIFWEIYSAAYQGIFMEVERQRAMPAFKQLVALAAAELHASAPKSRMAGAFAAAIALLTGNAAKNPEAAKIAAAAGPGRSDILDGYIDYSTFKPRGNYTRDSDEKAYFGAVRYLTSIALRDGDIASIHGLSPSAQAAARQWIEAYQPFIAPSRAELVWPGLAAPAGYVSRPAENPALFPLSWGWDNEIFDATINHADRPMLDGEGAPRELPSGLDLAAAMGEHLADGILSELGQFDRFPDLKTRLETFGQRFVSEKAADGDSLYARWIRSLAVQWSDDPDSPIAGPLHDSKRLQTGLASWATLRHTMILVNDEAVAGGAACRQAGFEPIVLAPPRGYVEPDPATFETIAGLFDATVETVRQLWPDSDPLGQDILRRLQDSSGIARHFGAMAEKEIRNEPLSPQDYADIEYVGGAAEHNFLAFVSLNSPDNAPVNADPIMPDSIMKVAGVAGTPETGWLEAAVGRPLEWDQIVPSFGRYMAVKGAVYSYYEFTAARPIADSDWLALLNTTPHPPWIDLFTSRIALPSPPAPP